MPPAIFEHIGVVAVGLIFPVVYCKGPSWVSYYTKFAIYYASLTVSATLVLPLAILRPKDSRNLLLPRYLLKATAKLLGLEWNFVDEELAKERLSLEAGPSVVVLNHQSSLDVLGLLCELWPYLDGRATVVAKKSLLLAGPFGLMAYMSGITFIDRSRGSEARTCLMDAVNACKAHDMKMIIFPEGTRNHSPTAPTMLNFKKGAFESAIGAQIPVQPVVFSHYNFFDRNAKVLNPGIVRIHVLEPIPTRGLPLTDAKHLADKTRTFMLETLEKDANLYLL